MEGELGGGGTSQVGLPVCGNPDSHSYLNFSHQQRQESKRRVPNLRYRLQPLRDDIVIMNKNKKMIYLMDRIIQFCMKVTL